MDEAISWIIAIVVAIFIGFIVGSYTKRQPSTGTGTDIGRIRRDLEDTAADLGRAADNNKRAADDNRRAGELNRTAADQNQRAQNLVRRARDVLNEAKHTDGDN